MKCSNSVQIDLSIMFKRKDANTWNVAKVHLKSCKPSLVYAIFKIGSKVQCEAFYLNVDRNFENKYFCFCKTILLQTEYARWLKYRFHASTKCWNREQKAHILTTQCVSLKVCLKYKVKKMLLNYDDIKILLW